jgi:hypothetical protein
MKRSLCRVRIACSMGKRSSGVTYAGPRQYNGITARRGMLTGFPKLGDRGGRVVVVVEVPCVGVDTRLLLLLAERVALVAEVEPAEDEARFDVERLKGLQVRLDVLLQRHREAAKGRHERLLGIWVVDDARPEVVGGLDAQARAGELAQITLPHEAGGPLHEVADHARRRVYVAAEGCWLQRIR